MHPRLKAAAEAGDINALYALFGEFPNVLKDNIDEIQFVDTPLHVAARAGHTHFAVEMISLMPSFGRKLNPDGLSPLHLALQNGHTETVIRLINIDRELIRVQGKERITPLHYVAEKNQSSLLAEFLCACPESVQDLTIRGETAVHITVRTGNFDAFEVLFGWIEKTDNQRMLQWKDEHGNTALHIAASTTQPEACSFAQFPTDFKILRLKSKQVVKKLIKHVKINDKNLAGLTAVEQTSDTEIRKMLKVAGAKRCSGWIPNSTSGGHDHLAKFMRWKHIHKFLNMKKLPNDMRNVVLVVATLVATTTYQVTVNPPSGIFRPGDNIHSIETLVVPRFYYYSLLFINSSAFAASIGITFLALQVSIHFALLQLCLYFMIFSFVISAVFATPKTVGAHIAISAPFVFYLCGFYWRNIHFWLEVCSFDRMPIGRYNPSRFFEMQRQMVGWYTIH